jgi:hypothetical protein
MPFVPVIRFIYRKRLSKSSFIKKFSIRAKIKNLHSEGRGVPCWKCPRDTLLGPLWVAHRDQTVRRQSIAGRSSAVSPLSLSSGLEQSPCHYRSASAGREVGWMLVLILMYLFSLKLVIPLFLIILLIFYFYLTWYDKFVLNFFFLSDSRFHFYGERVYRWWRLWRLGGRRWKPRWADAIGWAGG